MTKAESFITFTNGEGLGGISTSQVLFYFYARIKCYIRSPPFQCLCTSHLPGPRLYLSFVASILEPGY